MRPRHPRAASQAGTTLIEVLVTVMVLTLGVVSMAALQVASLKLGQSTYQRSQAVALSYEILDSMRANRADALAGRYDWRLGDPPPTNVPASNVPLLEVQRWLTDCERALAPYNGVAGITRNEAHFIVTIRWDDRYATERASLGEPSYQQFAVAADL